MKIRNGFVSNSSSSSFVLVLPDNFNPNTLDYSKCEYDELEEKDIKKFMSDFLVSRSMWEEENYEAFNAIHELLYDYVVDSFDVSSDCGQMNILDNQQLIKLLGV